MQCKMHNVIISNTIPFTHDVEDSIDNVKYRVECIRVRLGEGLGRGLFWSGGRPWSTGHQRGGTVHTEYRPRLWVMLQTLNQKGIICFHFYFKFSTFFDEDVLNLGVF